MKTVYPSAIADTRELVELLFAKFLFALAAVASLPLAFFEPFAFFAVVDTLLFVLRGGRRCLRTGAFEFVFFGRVLRKAPLTSSSCCALTINKTQPNVTPANGMIKSLDFISLPFEKCQKPDRQGGLANRSSPP